MSNFKGVKRLEFFLKGVIFKRSILRRKFTLNHGDRITVSAVIISKPSRLQGR